MSPLRPIYDNKVVSDGIIVLIWHIENPFHFLNSGGILFVSLCLRDKREILFMTLGRMKFFFCYLRSSKLLLAFMDTRWPFS